MSDTSTPAPEHVNVPVERVLAAYAEEVAQVTQRAIVAEAMVTVLKEQLAAARAHQPVESD